MKSEDAVWSKHRLQLGKPWFCYLELIQKGKLLSGNLGCEFAALHEEAGDACAFRPC